MSTNVLIKVIGTQRNLEGEEDKIEFFTEGSYYEKNGSFYIIYRESELTGLEGVTTSLKVEPERVVLNRMGKATLKQEFTAKEYYQCPYITPYGTISMAILTEDIQSDLTGRGGNISLKYNLFVEEEFISYNTLQITVQSIT